MINPMEIMANPQSLTAISSMIMMMMMIHSAQSNSTFYHHQPALSQHPFPQPLSNHKSSGLGFMFTPRLTVSGNMMTAENVEMATNYYMAEKDAKFQSSMDAREFESLIAIIKLISVPTPDSMIHHFDSFRDLMFMSSKRVNQEACLRQLRRLRDSAKQFGETDGYDSRDLDTLRLIDTWGRDAAGLYHGNRFWIGQPEICERLTLDMPDGEQLATRFCVASFRMHKPTASESAIDGLLARKSGVCLPETCDSQDYKDKFELIAEIREINARAVDRGNQTKLTDLYCLPDADSPARRPMASPATAITIFLFIGWLMLLTYATVVSSTSPSSSTMTESQKMAMEIYAMLSITNNARKLFDTSSASPEEVQARTKLSPDARVDQTPGRTNCLLTSPVTCAVEVGGLKAREQRKFVDLRVLEGIKVLSTCYIITGHVIMLLAGMISCFASMINNRSLTYNSANMMPAFAVNYFFSITGILTSYLMFKQNRSAAFITKPTNWLSFIFYRYLRIMPMYLLVTAYLKNVAKFTGSGPLWDYATSSLGHRRKCEDESWLWTLLFGANFKNPLHHCIPSAWYLANDFQFFLVTPLFLVVLHKNAIAGKVLLIACILLGFLAGVLNVLNSNVPDLRGTANFMPHGFNLYVNLLATNYTWPHCRISAYLMGLLMGFLLFEHEQRKIQHFERLDSHLQKTHDEDKKEKSRLGEDNDDNNNVKEDVVESHQDTRELSDSHPNATEPPTWSDGFIARTPRLCAFFLVGCSLTPVIGSRLPSNKLVATWAVALVMPSFHLLYSWSVGSYILLATTGYGNSLLNKFLSLPYWKPFARMSLCAVLVNIEVINYIVQTGMQHQLYTSQLHICVNIAAVLGTYAVSTLLCVLFEAPIKSLLTFVLTRLLTKTQRAKNPRRSPAKSAGLHID